MIQVILSRRQDHGQLKGTMINRLRKLNFSLIFLVDLMLWFVNLLTLKMLSMSLSGEMQWIKMIEKWYVASCWQTSRQKSNCDKVGVPNQAKCWWLNKKTSINLVVKVYVKSFCVEYSDTFSPVVRLDTIGLLITASA